MKTWNEIEQQLRNESAPAPAPELHHRILRAVREDRAVMQAAAPRHFALSWWLPGVAAAACALALTLALRPPAPAPEMGAPALSFAMLESLASAPVENEWQNLRGDLASAAQFVSSCMPSLSASAL